MEILKKKIKELAEIYSSNLKEKIKERESVTSRLFGFESDVVIIKSLELQAGERVKQSTKA